MPAPRPARPPTTLGPRRWAEIGWELDDSRCVGAEHVGRDRIRVGAGTGYEPTPLPKREVEKILVVKKEEAKPQARLGFEEGNVVRITSGPFADLQRHGQRDHPDQPS
jgi:hypothetical protein